MENNICKLCQNENTVANKTNSHILSHFLIKSAINYEGQNEREKELSYAITPQNVSVYFGQATLMPHILEKIYNKELSQDEIDKIVSDNTTNPYAKDYIFCSNCEKKLSILESEFQNKIYSKLPNKLTFSNDLNLIIRLFIYSLIWRMSIVKFNNFSLSSKLEKKLRKILDKNLADDKNKILENARINKENICSFPLIVSFFETLGDTTNNVIFVGKTNMPYFFIVNNLSFQFYEKKSHTRSTPTNFFDMCKFLNFKEQINYEEIDFKIGLLEDEGRKEVLKKVYSLMVKIFIEKILKIFRIFYKNIFGIKPNNSDEKLLLDKINNNKNLVENYSENEIINVMIEVIGQIKVCSSK